MRFFDEDGVPHSRIRFSYHAEDDKWCLHDSIDDSCVAKREAPPNAIDWVRV